MKYQLSKQQLDKITFEFDGQQYFGVLQHWYPLFWQRLSGCGPCCATNLLACIDKNTNLITKDDCIQTMRAMWKFVTPGLRGLNKAEKFAKGSNAFFEAYNLPFFCDYIICQPKDKTSLDKTLDFIKKSLQNDQPVAFLNLSNGDIPQLERWHWVTIVSLDQSDGDNVVTIFDSDLKFDMSLNLWSKTATDVSSFACYIPKQNR